MLDACQERLNQSFRHGQLSNRQSLWYFGLDLYDFGTSRTKVRGNYNQDGRKFKYDNAIGLSAIKELKGLTSLEIVGNKNLTELNGINEEIKPLQSIASN